jgi:hypothetical protein
VLNSPMTHEIHAKARRQNLLDEAAREHLALSARPPRAPLPNPAVLVRTLLARVRHQPLRGQGTHPAEGSWATTPEVRA